MARSMSDRFRVDTSRGEPCVRTNSRAEAEKWAAVIGGRVIDTEES